MRVRRWLGRYQLQWYVFAPINSFHVRMCSRYSSPAAVCQTDDACASFPIPEIDRLRMAAGGDEDDDLPRNMTCYRGGAIVRNQHQMCDVTSQSFTSHLFLLLMLALCKTARSSICCLTDHHKSHSAATKQTKLVLSNSGLAKSNHSTARWITAPPA